jgi:DNA-binding beta-propeller fold protein YncE
LSGEIADGGTEAIYVGTAGYENSFPSVVSAKTNRVVKNLPITAGFTPTAVCGNQVYGFDVRTYVYNLTTKAVTDLPDPVNVPESLYETYVYAGAAPPDGKSYWEPFTIDHRNGGLFLQGDAVYSTETNTVVALLPPMGTIVFSPDSSTAYILATDMIAKYNARSYAPIAQFPYPQITEMVVSASGSLLYAVAGSAVYVLDAKTGVQEQLILLPGAAANIALSPDGSTLFLTSAASNEVYLVSTATGLVTSVSLPNAPNGLVVMPSE